VIFLDTGRTSRDTGIRRSGQRTLRLNLTVTHPGPEAAAVPCAPTAAARCESGAVAPRRGRRAAWLTLEAGRRSHPRAAPIVSYDEAFGLVKINPMPRGPTTTSTAMSLTTISRCTPDRKGLPLDRLRPDDQPVAPGEDPRAGVGRHRKVECGSTADAP